MTSPVSPTHPEQRTASGRHHCFRHPGLTAILVLLNLFSHSTAQLHDNTHNWASHNWESVVFPIIEQSCLDCHSGAEAAGSLDLSPFRKLDVVIDNRRLWKHVAERVSDQEMPPADGPELSAEHRETLLAWLTETLPALKCQHDSHAANVTLRRLTRFEYRNTIRDLLGVDCPLAEDFPADEVGYGFDNIGSVLSVSPMLLEKYVAAAESITEQAIMDVEKHQVNVAIPGAHFTTTRGSRPRQLEHFLTTQGSISHFVDVSLPGTYEISISAYGTHAGDDWVEMGIWIDNRQVGVETVKSDRDDPSEHVIREPLTKGRRRIGISFNNDYYDPEHPDRSRRDRNLGVVEVAISGPSNLTSSNLPESHRRVLFVQPGPERTAEEAAIELIGLHATRAFRRPVTSGEQQKLLQLFRLAQSEGESFAGSIQLVLQAILVSPHFLYRVESPPPTDGSPQKLSDYELATALAYFLWGSTPDERLFALATLKQLSDPQTLRAEVDRMLADPKSSALVDNFAAQWLQLRILDSVDPDPDLFPRFSGRLRQYMITETKMLVADVIRRNQPVTSLLETDYSFLNRDLAQHYGLSDEDLLAGEFRRVSLEGSGRGGLLTHASILALTSNPTRTSPVKRGKWILENLLANPPPPALPDVPQLDAQAKLTGTLRQRMEQHRADPNCATCHRKMDGLGFALENFDAIGGFRTMDEGQPINSQGNLPGGITFNGPKQLQMYILEHKRDQFVRCICEKLYTFALGRGPMPVDDCLIDDISGEALKNDFGFSEIIHMIVQSEAFTHRRKEGASP